MPMPTIVRAKMMVNSVVKWEGTEEVKFSCVTEGSPEDNSFAKNTPSGYVYLAVNNEALHGHFLRGDVYYVDFNKA